MILGDLRKGSLEEIWNGAPMRRLRRDFRAGRLRSPLCAGCKEPSLEIGLPGRFYPVASAVRWAGGKSLVGAQNVNRDGFVPLSRPEDGARHWTAPPPAKEVATHDGR
jgi:hypothetical protein